MEEVTRTVKVKLDLTDNAKHLLHQTATQFNTAVSYTLDNAKKPNGYYRDTKKELHDEVYHDLREQTNLPANLCVRAYSKALEMINSTIEDWSNGNDRPEPEYHQNTIIYDKKTLTINDRNATISTIDGRIHADFILGDYQKEYLDDDDYKKRMGEVIYDERNDQYYLHIVIQKEVELEEPEVRRVMGVDLNLKNVAVTSTGSFYDGGELLWHKNHYFRVRRSLQDKGTRSAKQALQRLSGRENSYVLNRLHYISRKLVQEAREYSCTHIAVEDLTGIRESMQSWDSQVHRQMHEWAFSKLQELVEYKALEFGIRMVRVDPKNTSKSCSKCGFTSSANRGSDGWFECGECGYELDGDYNAAKNIGFELVESLVEESLPDDKSSSGLGNSHLALKNGMLTLNGRYTPNDSQSSGCSGCDTGESCESESMFKPTASAVGR